VALLSYGLVDVMSWDIFVQDLPDDIQSVRDIPPDFVPKSP